MITIDDMQKAVTALVDLAIEQKCGRGDDEKADLLRDELDILNRMPEEQRKFMDDLSVKLYELTNGE